jgi:hypothetical protein
MALMEFIPIQEIALIWNHCQLPLWVHCALSPFSLNPKIFCKARWGFQLAHQPRDKPCWGWNLTSGPWLQFFIYRKLSCFTFQGNVLNTLSLTCREIFGHQCHSLLIRDEAECWVCWCMWERKAGVVNFNIAFSLPYGAYDTVPIGSGD